MRRYIAVVVVATVVLAGCSGTIGGDADGGESLDRLAETDGVQAEPDRIGVAAGGAQDANAFRTNVREGYVPQPTDVAYEGLFHDYYFDTGRDRACERLFCPSYSRAVSQDPISGEPERFVTVGLNSGLSAADFERPRLDLVVVVDTSGSMDSPFDQYYYDAEGERRRVESTETKMAAARDALVTLTSHLEDGDRIGIVEFNDRASVVQQLRRVDEVPDGRLRDRIGSLRADGSTNLDDGMRTAVEMLGRHAGADRADAETRIVYVTDAQPNTGDVGAGSLHERLSSQAREGIHSTFVGVGVDFNSELVEAISSARGGNYYAIHSPRQFHDRMDEGFDFMVTPLVYDLTLSVAGDGYRIEQVYGTDSDRGSDELLHVNTLFPSRREGNRTEGGVILLELARTGDDPELRLEAAYEDRSGETHETSRTITFEDLEAPYYESTGVRKAIALARYGTVVRNWAAHERARTGAREFEEPPAGIEHRDLGRWEQRSVSLRVSPPYDDRLRTVTEYLRAEREALGAERLDRDVAVLESITAAAQPSPERVALRSPVVATRP